MSSSTGCIRLPSIHELLPEQFCRPLTDCSLSGNRPLINSPDVPYKRLLSPTATAYRTERGSQLSSVEQWPLGSTSSFQARDRKSDCNRQDDKKHVCQYCPKRFNRPSSLAIHIYTHTGDRPFPCPICGRRFSVNSNMRRHYRNHYADRNSAKARSPRLREPIESVMASYRYPPLDPPPRSEASTPSDLRCSDSEQESYSLPGSPPMYGRHDHALQGSFTITSCERGPHRDDRLVSVAERTPRSRQEIPVGSASDLPLAPSSFLRRRRERCGTS